MTMPEPVIDWDLDGEPLWVLVNGLSYPVFTPRLLQELKSLTEEAVAMSEAEDNGEADPDDWAALEDSRAWFLHELAERFSLQPEVT